MTIAISHLSKEISQSEIRNMSIECDRIGGINLSQGICDLELPLPVKLGAVMAMDNGVNHYTRYDGLNELREAIASKMTTYNKINTDARKNVVVSCGATGAFYSVCLALLNRGDEVILFEPYYGYHSSTLIAAGAVPVYVTLTPPEWSFDMKELEKAVTPRTKAIMICTPANPCGKVYSQNELNELAEFAVKHDLFVFTDEIYEYFVYDNHKHISPGSLDIISDRTITISGYSKTFSITGWRIGYAVCNEKWAQMIGYVSDLIYVCGPAPLQIGVAHGINDLPEIYYQDLCNEYFLKREKICAGLTKAGITPYIPHGAYYALANVSHIPGKSSKEKAMYILNKTGVATVPGGAFYSSDKGENLIRFCFAKSNSILDEACERMLVL
jgi:aminotransferase